MKQRVVHEATLKQHCSAWSNNVCGAWNNIVFYLHAVVASHSAISPLMASLIPPGAPLLWYLSRCGHSKPWRSTWRGPTHRNLRGQQNQKRWVSLCSTLPVHIHLSSTLGKHIFIMIIAQTQTVSCITVIWLCPKEAEDQRGSSCSHCCGRELWWCQR